MDKDKIFVIAIFIMMFLFIFTSFASPQTYENQYGLLEVTPDTIYSPTGLFKQYYNATWYYPADTLDIAFRFNHSLPYGEVYYNNSGNWINVDTNHIQYNNYHYYVIENVNFGEDETKSGYWEYRSNYKTGKWDLFLKRSSDSWQDAYNSGLYVQLDPWYDSNWEKRKTVTIDSSQIESTLTNFPIVLNFTDTDLRDYAQSDGDDICFIDSTNTTQYSHEIEYFDSATGKLTVWVEIPSLPHDSDLQFNMYFDNDGASNQEDVSGTWSSYTNVYHFEDANDVLNNNNGANNGVSFSANGLGYEGDFVAGDDDYISFSSDFGVDNADFTVEVYGKGSSADSESNYLLICFVGESKCFLSGTVFWRKISGNGYETSYASGYSNDDWRYIAVSYDLDGNTFVIDNGVQSDSDSNNGNMDDRTDNNVFGTNPDFADRDYDGVFTEIRFATEVKTEDWLITSYNTMNNATDGGFFSISGLEELQPPCECLLSNFSPVNGSQNQELDVNLSVDVATNGICSTIEYVNISIYDSTYNLINYTNHTSVPNGTYVHNTENDSLASYTDYYWKVETKCNTTENNTDYFTFKTKLSGGGAEIDYDELEEAIEDALSDYGVFKESDDIGIEINVLILILILVLLFLGFTLIDAIKATLCLFTCAFLCIATVFDTTLLVELNIHLILLTFISAGTAMYKFWLGITENDIVLPFRNN